jgi:hypothetical protein
MKSKTIIDDNINNILCYKDSIWYSTINKLTNTQRRNLVNTIYNLYISAIIEFISCKVDSVSLDGIGTLKLSHTKELYVKLHNEGMAKEDIIKLLKEDKYNRILDARAKKDILQ